MHALVLHCNITTTTTPADSLHPLLGHGRSSCLYRGGGGGGCPNPSLQGTGRLGSAVFRGAEGAFGFDDPEDWSKFTNDEWQQLENELKKRDVPMGHIFKIKRRFGIGGSSTQQQLPESTSSGATTPGAAAAVEEPATIQRKYRRKSEVPASAPAPAPAQAPAPAGASSTAPLPCRHG